MRIIHFVMQMIVRVSYTTVFAGPLGEKTFALISPCNLPKILTTARSFCRTAFTGGLGIFLQWCLRLAGPAVQCGVQNGRIRFFCIFFLLNFFSPAGKLAASGKALRGVACRRHYCCSHLLFSRDTLKSCGRLHLSRGENFLIRLREYPSSESLSVSPTNLESDETGASDSSAVDVHGRRGWYKGD